MFQLGFDTEAFGLVFTSDYKAKVLAGQEGKDTRATVEKFIERVVSSCTDLSFSKDKMLKEFLFTDSEITYEKNHIMRVQVNSIGGLGNLKLAFSHSQILLSHLLGSW